MIRKLQFTFCSSVQNTCHYKTLKLSSDATFSEIKQSYLKLAKIYHPDVNKDIKQNSRFKQIQDAYNTLSDKELRNKYDQENGLISTYNQSVSFQNESQYKKFTDIKDVDKVIQEDQQFFDYFDKKYFKNRKQFKNNNLDVDQDPYQVTNKMFIDKILNEQKKEDKYKIFHEGTPKAYYDLKDDKEERVFIKVLYDFRYFLLFGFTLLTFNTVVKQVQCCLNEKQQTEDISFLKNSKGIIVKQMPINIV